MNNKAKWANFTGRDGICREFTLTLFKQFSNYRPAKFGEFPDLLRLSRLIGEHWQKLDGYENVKLGESNDG